MIFIRGKDFHYKNAIEMIFIIKNAFQMNLTIKINWKWFLL